MDMTQELLDFDQPFWLESEPAATENRSLENCTVAGTAFLVKGKSGLIDEQRYLSTEFNQHILGYLHETLGFRFSLIPAPTLEKPVNGVWTGAGALLKNGSVDLSIDLNAHVPFRAQYFALLHPLFTDKLAIYFRQPALSTVRNIFTQPFTADLWCAIILSLAIAVTACTCIKRIGTHTSSIWTLAQNAQDADIKMFTDNDNYVLWLISFLTIQGWYQRGRTWSLNIVCTVASLADLILYVSYSANLVSLFAVQTKPIGNLVQFISSGIPLNAADTVLNVFTEDTLRIPSNPSLYKKVRFGPRVDGYTTALDKSQPFPTGYMTLSSRFYTEVQTGLDFATDAFLCKEITEIQANTVMYQKGWVMPKGAFWLRERFNARIIGLYTSGLLWREKREYTSLYRLNCDPALALQASASSSRTWKNIAMHELTMADTSTAFMAFAIGAVVSIVAMVLEKCHEKRKQRHEEQRPDA